MILKDKRALPDIIRIICFALIFMLSICASMSIHKIKVFAIEDTTQTGSFTINAQSIENGGISVSWEAGTEPATYQVERSIENGNAYIILTTLENVSGKQEYIDTDVVRGNTYYYRVIKLNDNLLSDSSIPVSVIYTWNGPDIVSVKMLKDSNYIKIKWNKVQGVSSYDLYRLTNNKNEKKITTTKKAQYTDKKTTAGNLYSYCVAVHDEDDGLSEKSELEYYFIEPSEFNVYASFTSKNKEKLTWDKVPAASSYIVYKKNASGKYVKLGQTKKTTYTDSDIKKGKTYKYKVSYVVELPDGSTIEKKSSAISVYASMIDPNKKMVALTFDDGPGRYTQEIVDCLKKNDARATFFVLGCNVDNYKSAVKNAHKIGCEIGNHSYNHKILTRISAEDVKKQMSDTDEKIKKVTGSNADIMRCPGGGYNKTVREAVGKPLIMWSIDTLDWKTRNTDKTISAVMNNVKDGDIILMHDIHEPTKRAALYLIPQLKKKGYQLVTVSELAEYRGHTLKKGNVYFNLRKKK